MPVLPKPDDRAFAPGLLAAGAILVVAAAVPYRMFDLARFFAPKELVMHMAALGLALLGLRRADKLELNRVDLLLALYLALSCVSALLARDRWLSTSALAVTLSGAAVFWGARSAAAAGARSMIVAAAAAAAVAGAAASLAQAYGFASVLFSLNRVPGGTLGNRNFMAHLAVICAPALVLAALRARRGAGFVCGAAGVAIVADALVLSRSRAALLGLAAGAAVLAYGAWRAGGRWRDAAMSSRQRGLLLAGILGVLAALFVPNTLEWKSDSPYLDTVSGIVDYRRGSGHGRLVQYARTLRIAAAHPLLGAGPGNWALAYPRFSEGFDPSIDYYTGRTINPWPSSDWMAILSERGAPALAALLLALLWLLLAAWRRTAGAAGADEYREGLTLAATLLGTFTVACFDAVLLLPASSFMAWAILGALAPPLPALRQVTLSSRARRRALTAVALAGTAAVLRSSGQVAAMALYSKARTVSQFALAARLDPGNVRIRSRLSALRGGMR
ncbi:MAG TPA: O-antigen ligase family protein [Elusimicrobiales bacterium]|nr:O-antigen ligase family protein [Elusimicrobiales bacterium]